MLFLFLLHLLSCIPGAEAANNIRGISAGGIHAILLTEEGRIFLWGANRYGQLGLGDISTRHVPTEILLDEKVVSVGARRDQSCLLFENGQAKCVGNNEFGQLGLGKTAAMFGATPTEVLPNAPALSLGSHKVKTFVLGETHSCLLSEAGRLFCFGSNTDGELGIGNASPQVGSSPAHMGEALASAILGEESAAAACAGRAYTCALLASGRVKCWGNADSIGSGGKASIGKEEAEMKSLHPVDLGNGFTVKKIACAERAVCALSNEGVVKCWGRNSGGVLGQGQVENIIVGDEASEMGENLPIVEVEPGLAAKDIACGAAHCCAVMGNGALKCWGKNSVGQLGLGDSLNRGTKSEQMGRELPFVDLGAHYRVKQLALGSVSSCALLESSDLKCWGGNVYGQLGGTSSLTTVGTLPFHMANNLKSVQLP